MQVNSKKTKRIVLAASAALGAILLSVNGSATLSLNVKEQESKRETLKDKSEQLKKDLSLAQKNVTEEAKNKNTLNEKIKSVEEEIDNSNIYISELEKKIKDLEDHILEIEKDIDEKTELLKEALVSIYKAGDTSALDIVLGAKNFEDLFEKADIVKSVSNKVKELMNELHARSEELEEQKKNIENMKQHQEEEKMKLESKRLELQDLLDQSEKLLEEYQESEQTAKKHIDENDAQIKAIDAAIDRYYQEQRRKEEEMRKKQQQSNSSESVAPVSNVVHKGSFSWPVPGFSRISSDFFDCVGRRSQHCAIDIAGFGIYGASIVAAGDGVIIGASNQDRGGYGKYVFIDHGNGKSTRYGHMSTVNVTVGQRVSRGQVIGHVGNTGFSTGPHLHFEVRNNRIRENPLNYVKP